MSSVEALQKCLRDKLETMSGFGDEKKQIAILKKFFAEFDTDGSGNVARLCAATTSFCPKNRRR